MKLYWAPKTRASRALWMLEEAGVDYELETVDIRDSGRDDSPEFRSASPLGKVPALVDGYLLAEHRLQESDERRYRSSDEHDG